MARGEKTRAGGKWTEAYYWNFIRSNLRLAWNKYPVKYEVLKDARRPYIGEDKRTKWEYKCSRCSGWFKTKETQVDHIEPAGSLNSYSDLSGFCKRLFCEKDNLRIVCKSCHKYYTDKNRLDKD